MTKLRPRGKINNMEVLFELIGEIAGGLYFGLAELIVPDKTLSKARSNALRFICAVIMLGSLAVLWAGVIFLVDGMGFTAGVIMTSVGGALIAIHIALAVTVTVCVSQKRKKAKKHPKKGESGDEI